MKLHKPSVRDIIRSLVQEVLEEEDSVLRDDCGSSHAESDEEDSIEELNSTANADGYQTPYAFDVDSSEEDHEKNIKDKAEVFDYKSTRNEGNNTVKLEEGKSLFHLFRDHPDYSPEQKVGVTIREVNKLLTEIEKLLRVSSRFKAEANVTTDAFWKTTNRYLSKIDEKIFRISRKVKEIR
jgi:hypothetical protein